MTFKIGGLAGGLIGRLFDPNRVRKPDLTEAELRERRKARATEEVEFQDWIRQMRALEDELARQKDQAQIDAEFAETMRENLIRDLDAQLIDIWADRPSEARLARYDGDFRRFQNWCAEVNQEDFKLSTLPASPELVALYLLAELDRGASYQSIRRSYIAISFAHRAKGVFDPCPDPQSDDPRDSSARPFPAAVVRLARKKWLENKSAADQKASAGMIEPAPGNDEG
jgi:hypothetical protein